MFRWRYKCSMRNTFKGVASLFCGNPNNHILLTWLILTVCMGERLLSLVLINYLHVYPLFVGRRLASRCGAHHPVSIAAVFLPVIQRILLPDSCELGSLLSFFWTIRCFQTWWCGCCTIICNTLRSCPYYTKCALFTFFLLKRLCVILCFYTGIVHSNYIFVEGL